MDSHLLSLFTLHGAAPGVLDVVFGPDGEVEGAPSWTGPAFTPHRPENIAWWPVLSTDPNGSVWTETADQVDPGAFRIRDAALDLRVPSVAARLAGLCARALDVEATGQAWATEAGEIQKDYWALRYCDQDGYVASCAWMKTTGKPDRRSLSPCPTSAPIMPAGLPDVASFLAALTLALAPKIAALGGGR